MGQRHVNLASLCGWATTNFRLGLAGLAAIAGHSAQTPSNSQLGIGYLVSANQVAPPVPRDSVQVGGDRVPPACGRVFT